MTREDIIKQVNSILAEEFETESSDFDPNAKVYDALSLDSLSLVDLVAVIQSEYGVKIPTESLRKIITFSDLYDFIESHLEK